MKKCTVAHYLGEEAFQVNLQDGKIIRTAVSELDSSGGYQLLSGGRDTSLHFFSFEKACKEAAKRARKRLESPEITRGEERVLEEFVSNLGTDEFKKKIFSANLIEGAKLHGLLPERTLRKGATFPKEYFAPREAVFGLVTPETHNGISPHWRPKPYFILKMKVERVTFAPVWPNCVYYAFEHTHYTFPHTQVFASEKEAREQMVRIFSEETGGTIEARNLVVYPASVEKKHHDAFINRLLESRHR